MADITKIYALKLEGLDKTKAGINDIGLAWENATKFKKQYEAALNNKNAADAIREIDALKKTVAKLREELKKAIDTNTDTTKGLSKLEKAEKALAFAISEEGKRLAEINERRLQQNRINKEAAKNNIGLIGSYRRLSNQLNEARRNYKDLVADGKEFTDEAKKQKTAIDILDGRLKGIDKKVGQYGRNVGNYKSAWEGLRGTFISYFSIGAGLTGLLGEINEGIGDARVIEGVDRAFRKLDDPTLLNNLQESTKNTVNTLDLMTAAVQADNLQVPVEQLGTFFGFAQQRALDTGESVDHLVNSIVTGIGRKSPLILDNLGISAVELKENLDGVSLAQATTGQVAEAVGKIIKQQQEETGNSLDSNQVKLLKARAEWENTRTEVGTKLLPILTNVTAFFTALGAVLLQLPLPIVAAGIGLVTVNLLAQNRELIKSKILLIQDAVSSITLANAKRTLSGALGALGTSFKGLFAIMRANPILFFMGLIVGLIGWFVKLTRGNEKVQESFAQVKVAVSQVIRAFRPLISFISKVVSAFARTLGPVIEKFANNVLVPLAIKVLPKIALAFRIAAGGISSFVSVFGFGYEQIKQIAGGFIDTLKGIFTVDRDLIRKGVEAQVGGFKTLFKGLGKAAKDGFKEGFELGDTFEDAETNTGSTTRRSRISGGGFDPKAAEKARKERERKRKELERAKKRAERARLAQLKKEFEERRKIIDRQLQLDIQNEEDTRRKIKVDANKSNLEKAKAHLEYTRRVKELTEDRNRSVAELERIFSQKSLEAENKRKDEIEKLRRLELEDLRKIEEANFKDIKEAGEKELQVLRIQFANRRALILNDEELSPGKRRNKLKKLAVEERRTIDAQEIINLRKNYDQLKQLHDLGLASEKQVLDAKLALQNKANNNTEEFFKKEVKSYKKGIAGFTQGLGDLFKIDLNEDTNGNGITNAMLIAEGFNIAKDAMNDYYRQKEERVRRDTELKIEDIELERQRLQEDAQTAQEREFIDKQYQQKKQQIEKEAGEKLKKQKTSEITISYYAELASIAAQAAGNPANKVTFGGAGIAQYAALAAAASLKYVLGLRTINRQQFEFGGLPKSGGKIGGKPHPQGGTPFHLGEAEKNETAIITKGVNPNEHLTVSGTAHQILSGINARGGGVNFAPGAAISRYQFGGYLGSQLQPPVFQFSNVNSDNSQILTALVSRIENWQSSFTVNQVTSSVRDAIGKEVNQINTAKVFDE